jgi:hypothetical protein
MTSYAKDGGYKRGIKVAPSKEVSSTKELQWRPPLQLPLQINVAAQAACQD